MLKVRANSIHITVSPDTIHTLPSLLTLINPANYGRSCFIVGVKFGLSLKGKNSLRTFDKEVLRKTGAEFTVVIRKQASPGTGVDRKKMLKRMLKMWTGFRWTRTEFYDRPC
jgi:hypothetical protein